MDDLIAVKPFDLLKYEGEIVRQHQAPVAEPNAIDVTALHLCNSPGRAAAPAKSIWLQCDDIARLVSDKGHGLEL